MSLRKLIKDLQNAGYVLVRQKGTHRRYARGGNAVTVPMKDNDKIGLGVELKIRKQAGLR